MVQTTTLFNHPAMADFAPDTLFGSGKRLHDTELATFFGKLAQMMVQQYGIATETLAAHKTLTTRDVKYQRFDPDGSGRNVTLPAEADSAGLSFAIHNIGSVAADLTVKNDGGTTLLAMGIGQTGTFVCDGTNWRYFFDATTDAELAAHAADVDAHHDNSFDPTEDEHDGLALNTPTAANPTLTTDNVFVSTEQTGTGAEQDVAHGLGGTPAKVFAALTETAGAGSDIAHGTHDGTNCKFTVTADDKFMVIAIYDGT